MPVPPPRYRIIERDRRLVVVDNWADGGPRPIAGAPPEPAMFGQSSRMAFDGRTRFTTHRLFDARAPRTVILDPGSAAMIGRIKGVLAIAGVVAIVLLVMAPYLLLPLILLGTGKVRRALRKGTTAWIDRVASPAPSP